MPGTTKPIPPLPPPVFTATTDPERLVEVGRAIDRINRTAYELSPGKAFTQDLMAIIVRAQDAANHARWDDAHNAIWEAVYLVNRAVESKNSRRLRGWLVFSPILTVIVLIVFRQIMDGLLDLRWVDSVLEDEYFPFLWIGAIGGATAAFWGVIRHSHEMDFDTEYLFWYLMKPLLGAITAGVAVLVVKAGLFTLQQTTATTNDLPLYVMAFLAGFSERFFIGLIDRVLAALFGGQAPEIVSRPSSMRIPPGTPPPSGNGAQVDDGSAAEGESTSGSDGGGSDTGGDDDSGGGSDSDGQGEGGQTDSGTPPSGGA